MNYYIADTHFGHENVINFDKRPFENINEMDKVMIQQWNSVVKDEDDVYILGDFCFKSVKQPMWYIKQLKGKKHLIVGNHDNRLLKDEVAMKDIVSVNTILQVNDGEHTCILCHYPLAEWNHYHRGAWHIYGHIHNKKDKSYEFMRTQERALNAGCMINGYIPVKIEQLIENNRVFIESEE